MTIEEFRGVCLSMPGAWIDFPFDNSTMTVKIGPRERGRIFALADVNSVPPRANLKCEPDLARDLRAAHPHSVSPGYHMNKEHWNTVLLANDLDDEMIEKLVTHSYELVRANLPKRFR